MTTKKIEQVLNNFVFLNDYDVELGNSNNTYTVDINLMTPRDSEDMARLLQLKNKIRQQVNKAYKISFIIRFTT